MARSSRRRRRELLSRSEVELREEIRFHLEMKAREFQQQGMADGEAWRAALDSFGNPDEVAEAAAREDGDEPGRGGVMDFVESILQDARYTLRGLGRSKTFSAVAVLTLALGVGASSSVYSVVHGVLLTPLAFPESERLVAIWSRWVPESGYDWPQYPIGSPEYFDYQDQNRSMETVAAVSTERLSFTGGVGDPVMVTAGAVSPSMFATLRTPPFLGRTLVEVDGGAEPAPVIVLGYDFWQRRFGGDSTVVGRTFQLGWENGANAAGSVVVGVMPPGFSFPDPDVDLWAPLKLDPARVWREGHWFSVIGRLAPGETLQSAQAEMAGIMERWRDDYPDHHRGHFLYMTPLLDDMVGNVRPALLLLLGAVGFLLLIACANVASLLLARGQLRGREIAVRSALGAGRGRLARQLLTESVILATMGGGLGLLVAYFGVDALLALEGGSLPRLERVGIDGNVLAFTASLVAVTTLVFGLVPAGALVRTNLARAFSSGDAGSGISGSRLRFRSTLVASEITLAVLLVVGAGLMAKSVWRTLHQDLGFDVENLLVTRLTFPDAAYTPMQRSAFMEQITARMEAHPGVVAAGVANRPPVLFDESWTRFSLEDGPEPASEEEAPTASFVLAGQGLFDVLGVSLVRGRLFDATDGADTPPVVVIDQTMADRYWPGEDPIGRRIRFGEDLETVVGIVSPARFDGLVREAPTFYALDRQVAASTGHFPGTLTLLLRTRDDPAALAGPVRDAVRALDPNMPVLMMRTMADLVGNSIAGPRFIMTLLAVFAAVALLLGATGIYGVISQAVSQRRREIGIRRALGAEAPQVLKMILREGFRVALFGVASGLAAAVLLGRVMAGLLYEVTSTDPSTYVTVGGGVLLVALAATFLPARRATRVDPMQALRVE